MSCLNSVRLGRNQEQLKILYDARGSEIERLQSELAVARADVSEDGRRLKHEIALARGENDRLSVQLEQARQVHDATIEENRALREELQTLRAVLDKQEDAKRQESITSDRSVDRLSTFNCSVEIDFGSSRVLGQLGCHVARTT